MAHHLWSIFLLLSLTAVPIHSDKSPVCQTSPPIDFSLGNTDYYFSWLHQPNRKFEWGEAVRHCWELCMEPIALDTESNWRLVKDMLRLHNQKYIWTGGRKCNYRGCEALQPSIAHGWFWVNRSHRYTPIPNPFRLDLCRHCEWSTTGGLGLRQPDNREGRRKGNDEGSIAILNNIYRDGIKWHDVAPTHKKPIICERRK